MVQSECFNIKGLRSINSLGVEADTFARLSAREKVRGQTNTRNVPSRNRKHLQHPS